MRFVEHNHAQILPKKPRPADGKACISSIEYFVATTFGTRTLACSGGMSRQSWSLSGRPLGAIAFSAYRSAEISLIAKTHRGAGRALFS
jgi:hypothetical protein